MNYTEKITILNNLEAYSGCRMNANDSESPIKMFKLSHTITKSLKKGDTIEIALLPSQASVIGIIFENDFKDGVEYSIGVSSGSVDCLGRGDGKSFVNWIAPYEASKASVYLTIDKGTVNAGTYIKGAVGFC